MRLRPALATFLLLAAGAAQAEVDADHRLVEDSGYTLRKKEWKVGIYECAYGVTDRLQLESAVFGDLATFLNFGGKYMFIDEPQLAMAASAWGGFFALGLVGQAAIFDFGGQLDATVPLAEKLFLHMTLGGKYWRLAAFDLAGSSGLLFDGRIAWLTAKTQLEWDFRPAHVFFVNVGTPTSWMAAIGQGSHEFDALDFWQATVGYQLSKGPLNARIDLGYGPSAFSRGLAGGIDVYLRF